MRIPLSHFFALKLELGPGSRCGAITSVRSPLPHSPGRRRGTRCRRCAAWTKGNKGYPNDQIHCGGGARSGTRRGCGKIVAFEDFASFLIYVFGRRSFLPLGFFSFFCTAWYVCTFSILGCCRMGFVELCGAARSCIMSR